MTSEVAHPKHYVDMPLLPGCPLVRRGLVIVTLGATAFMIFWVVVGLFKPGGLAAIDHGLISSLHTSQDPNKPIGPRWFEAAMRDVTALGSNTVVGFVTITASLFLLVTRRLGPAVMLMTTMVFAAVLSFALKAVFDRERPPFLSTFANAETASFPSSHAMLATVLYILLAAIAAREFADRRIGTLFMAVGAGLAVAIGFSRVYLGAHWPSDVLAGWLVGSATVLAAWHIARSPPPPGAAL